VHCCGEYDDACARESTARHLVCRQKILYNSAAQFILTCGRESAFGEVTGGWFRGLRTVQVWRESAFGEVTGGWFRGLRTVQVWRESAFGEVTGGWFRGLRTVQVWERANQLDNLGLRTLTAIV
jgi:hypothetical protein